MMPRPEIQRRKFEELHPRDRNVKTNRKTRIEANWGCSVQDCIPMKIRPRVELKKGAKIRVGDIAGSEEIWWNWSVELLRGLEELSTLMAGKPEVAEALMMHEVQKRQSDGRNPQRKVAELLLGDIQRIVDNVKRHQAQAAEIGNDNQQQDPGMMALESEHKPGSSINKQEGEAQVGAPEYSENNFSPENMPSYPPGTAYNHEGTYQADNTPQMKALSLINNPARLAGVRMPQSTRDLNAGLQVDAMEMRARAHRLRSQAMRLEAEAFDLESEAAIARRGPDA